jgi:hypothetical protein
MYWDWKTGGLELGLIFVIAAALVKPIGVSTQFVILDGVIASAIHSELVVAEEDGSGFRSTNAYLNKSGGKYAKSVANPINYSFVFVLCMVLGGFIGRLFTKAGDNPPSTQIPELHRRRFGDSGVLRLALAFGGGVLVLWGSRLAGGCTSGHMMSGMMQTAVSGYVFAAAVFATAIPVAILVYKK